VCDRQRARVVVGGALSELPKMAAQTPLFAAIDAGQPEVVVRALLAAGADGEQADM
jgi:hypothetical protein